MKFTYFFDIGKVLFDGIEVWAVGRQVEQPGAFRLDRLSQAADFVSWQIVHDHDVSRLEPQVYGDAESALKNWKKSVRAAIGIRKKFGDRVCLIKFEDLVAQTESVMRFLSEFLRIPYEDILLEPTFNGIPIQPVNGQKTDNSHAKHQSITESKTLDDDRRVLIEKMTAADYQTALREVVDL